MKTAIYVEDGAVQIVLTPEGDFEKSCFKLVGKEPKIVRLYEGSFYDCRGGWFRQSQFAPYGLQNDRRGDSSLIIRVDDEEKPVKDE